MKLKELLNEAKSRQINEAKTPFYQTGFQAGPNGTGKVDTSTKEGKEIVNKMNQLYSLVNDKNLIEFAKGYVNSVGSSQYRYEGLETVAKALLDVKKR